MAVTSNTGTQTPITGAETTVATIAGGPFDFVSVYFQGGSGGAGGLIGINLYAIVAGTTTRVATAQQAGSTSATGALVEFVDTKNGATGTTSLSVNQNNSFLVNAAGTTYFVTVIDLSTQPLPPGGSARQACTMTIAGVNAADTAADTPQTNTGAVAAGNSLLLATSPGFVEQMDVSLTQTSIPGGTVFVAADCGGGTVRATVKSIQISGSGGPTGVSALFRNLILPVATRYFVGFTNTSNTTTTVTLTSFTYTSAAGGGGGGAIVLSGNANGPSNNNRVESFNIESVDADITAAQFNAINATGGIFYAGLSGLTQSRTVNLPASDVGSTITVKDQDGSLAAFNIILQPSDGSLIDGAANLTMTAVAPGPFGAVTLERVPGPNWAVISTS